MTNLEKLRETLNNFRGDSFTDALFIVVDHMVEAGEGNISWSSGTIGIDVTAESILVCDIDKGTDIAVFTLNLD